MYIKGCEKESPYVGCVAHKEGFMEDSVTKAIEAHLETMTEEERIFVLQYIHALKDLR